MNPAPSPQPASEIVSVEEAVRRLGGTIAVQTIRNKACTGEWGKAEGMVYLKIGRRDRLAIHWPTFFQAVTR